MGIYKLVAITVGLFLLMPRWHLLAETYCDWQLANLDGLPSIEQPLCELQGNEQRGKALVIDRSKGNCLACHIMPIPEEEFHGEVGPPLFCLAMRYSQGHLRARIVDATLINPSSIMPGYYRHPKDNNRLAQQYRDITFLSAQEVEDVVAYLLSLRCE